MLPRLSHRTPTGIDSTDFLIPTSIPSMDTSRRTSDGSSREKSDIKKSRKKSSGVCRSQFDLMDIERERTQTPHTARLIAEKHAELEVEHNWLLKEEEQRQKQKLVQTKVKLSICLPENDPLDSIHQRLEEIQSMVKPRAEIPDFLTDFTFEQRNQIMSVSAEDVEDRKQRRRKNWKILDIFRHALKLILMINKSAIPRPRYHNQDEPDARQSKNDDEDNSKRAHQRSSLSFEVQLALSSSPEHRTTKDLKRITWVLRATRAYKHLFPDQLESDLAQVVAYERYENNRLIAYQGKSPDRFYYVLNGKIQKLREYQLSSGSVNKSMGFLNKGMSSDTEELIKQWPREYHLVAKGSVEVLILHREDFMRLKHTTHGPPIEFLRSVDLFSEFPCEDLLSRPDAIEFKYYGQNTIIAKDALSTPWIHVIKSGHVKVVRIQYVIDVSNDSLFEGQTTEELGCRRAFSHASAMLGVVAKQRQQKALKEEEENGKHNIKHHKTTSKTVLNKRNYPKIGNMEKIEEDIILPDIRDRETDEYINSKSTLSPTKIVSLPPIVKATLSPSRVGEGFHQHGTFLTREKTEADTVLTNQSRKKEQIHRRAYLQLDVLSVGDIFGLETLDPPDSSQLMEEGPAVSLLSDGAEVIKIHKRFFLQRAQNNTILKVETLQRQFLTTDEVKSILYDQETWTQYKQILMQRLTTNLSPKKTKVSVAS